MAPPHYALTNNESLKADTKKAKIKKHTECGNPLSEMPGQPGKFYCKVCMKAGWPVKAKA